PDGSFLADSSITLLTGGPLTVLVDTGGPWGREKLLQSLAQAGGRSPGDVTHLVCTHGHLDHVGNLNLFPGATLLVGQDLSRGPGRFLPNPLAQGRPLELHRGHLEVVATPGHTRDHVSLVWRDPRVGTVVVAGDLFEEEEDEGGWERWSEDPPEQRRSRSGVVAMADLIVPGHGPPFRVLRE
ncbi:MBLC1 protein, partial [Brachypteracias leptosomus]|nr:MBLC1 protein [Brachypteracias leptosomus]